MDTTSRPDHHDPDAGDDGPRPRADVHVVGGGLGPYFAASVHDATGSYELAFQTFALLNLLSVAGLCFGRDER